MTTTTDDFDGDPHPAWAKKVAAWNKVLGIRDLDLEDDELGMLANQRDALEDRIADTTARTLAGVREQVMLGVEGTQKCDFINPAVFRALENAVATLDKMLAIERRREKRRQRHAPGDRFSLRGLPPGAEG